MIPICMSVLCFQRTETNSPISTLGFIKQHRKHLQNMLLLISIITLKMPLFLAVLLQFSPSV